MKKTGLGKDPLSWIKTTERKAPAVKSEPRPAAPAPAPRPRPQERQTGPKFMTFEVRLTTLLRDDQLEYLEKIIRDIRKNRSREYRAERITKNTLLRALIDAFMKIEFDTGNIGDEQELLARLLAAVRS